MGQDDRLLTILHISDLHIGEIDPANGDALVSAAAQTVFANQPWLDGLLGHHAFGLKELDAFHSQLAAAGEQPLLVVTGDLTRCGNSQEISNAADFLGGFLDLQPPSGNLVGLETADWKRRSIPGNHDHWSGRPTIFGGPTREFFNQFPAGSLPWVLGSQQLANGRVLTWIGVNSDADVSPWGPTRLCARGSFASQLRSAAARLGLRQPEEIRVLLVHHSWHRSGARLSMEKASRQAFAQFLRDCDIQIVLTGHIHDPYVDWIPPTAPSTSPVLECRCGTTTIVDVVPSTWRNVFRNLPKRRWPPNSLLVHRIYEESEAVRWEVQTFVRVPGRGFKPNPGIATEIAHF
jgi:3',5'-cyclic AMP phosphodiesterase CpdA